MNKTIDDIRDLTQDAALGTLDQYSECAIIRGTGFGKTWLVTKIAYKYDKVLFLYPADIIKNTAKNVAAKVAKENFTSDEELSDAEIENLIDKQVAKNVEFMSYMKFAMLTDDEIKRIAQTYDLIIADECHRLGGERTKMNYYSLMKEIKENNLNTHRLITTATPYRTKDEFDVIREFAGGHTVFDFTISDMIESGYMKAPKYACGIYSEKFGDKKYDRGQMTSVILKHSKIFNPPEKIREICDEYLNAKQKHNMIFLCFYSDSKSLHELERKVNSWFKKTYPDHHVNNIIVSSENAQYKRNVNRLLRLQNSKDDTITLIHSINMLNLGYHINAITGTVMLRNTDSHIIYTQQVGRVYDTTLDTDENRIVFDFVDNISRRALFDSDFEDSYIGRIKYIDFDIIDNLKEQKNQGHISEKEYNQKVTDYLNSVEIERKPNKKKADKNIIKTGRNPKEYPPLDMDAEFASFKKQMEKLVTEPESILIRQTLIAFFQRWCLSNDIKFPLTQKELKVLYEVSWGDFMESLKATISKYGDKILDKTNRYDDTLDKYFIAMQDDKDGSILNLDIFAKNIGQTSVPRIMELIKDAA